MNAAAVTIRSGILIRARTNGTAFRNRNLPSAPDVEMRRFNRRRRIMNKRLAVSLVAASLLASGSAFAQSTTAAGAANGARAGHDIAGPVGEIVGGTVGAAVGAGLEIPNAVIGSIPRDEPSVVVRERVVVGEPLPDTVVVRPVPRYAEYHYAIINDHRVIVDARTRRVVRVID
jgi:hypothetical protein